ncbi:FimB/Mfa2 family fimbrial subunit [Parabacteroides sp.]
MRNNIYTYTKAVVASLLLSFFLPACSDNEGGTPEIPEAKMAQLTISLSSLDNSAPAYTKALDEKGYIVSDIIEDSRDDNAYEHRIAKWWIVVMKQIPDETSKKVYQFDRLVSNSPTADNTHPDSETQVRLELEVGQTYKFYAFANLEGLEKGNEVKNWIEGLNASITEEEIQAYAVSLRDLSDYDGSDDNPNPTAYIPMSSYGYTATVQADSDGDNNKVDIDLIRLLAKVNITVTNATATDITIQELTMGKFRHTGDIFLLPYDVKTGDNGTGNLFVKEAGGENKLLNPSFPEKAGLGESGAWKLNTNPTPTVGASGKKESYMFYINETAQGNQGTNGEDMTISLKIANLDRDSEPQNTNFFFVRRNDLLEVPILVSNAQTTIEFDQKRMPIGGIPESIKFGSGAIIANKELTTPYGGDIVITYKLDLSELGAESYELSYYNDKDFQSGKRYCSAVLQKQTDLLLEPAEKVILGSDTDPNTLNAPWLSATDGEYGYKLTPDTKDSDIIGSFTITAQELSYAGTATIKLTLVAEVTTADQNTSQVILPYTLTIKNGKSEKGE